MLFDGRKRSSELEARIPTWDEAANAVGARGLTLFHVLASKDSCLYVGPPQTCWSLNPIGVGVVMKVDGKM
jgi:hypothetical protein